MSEPARNGSIDYARFAGALAIVWFHLRMPGASTALAALPMFVLLQVYFGFGRSLGPQVARILAPWAAWSAFYACGKIAQALAKGTPIADEFAPWMLLTGTSIHLWYLPFSIAAVAVAGFLPSLLSWRMIYVLGAAISVLCLWLSNTDSLATPLAQWVTVIPAAAIGLFAGGPAPKRVVLGASLAAALVMMFGLGWDRATWQTLVAIAVFALAIQFPMPSTPLSARLASISFGIYLVHPAVYSVALQILPPRSLLIYAAVAAGSAGLTLLLARIPGRLRLV